MLENISFAKIATKVQESLAAVPLVEYSEMAKADAALVQWWENLPSVLKDYEPCSESIKTVRTVMRWRYHNQRMLLHRPTLLSYAMRRVPYFALRTDQREAIEKCRECAELTIRDIGATWHPNRVLHWNAAWLIFQAAMVPLLGFFITDYTANDPRGSLEACQAQIDIVIETLSHVHPLGHRALDAISRLLEASKNWPDDGPETGKDTGGSYTTPLKDASNTSQSPSAVFNAMPGGGSSESNPPPAAFDNASGHNLWDYLSWSDNNWCPELADIDGRYEPMNIGLFGDDMLQHMPDTQSS